MAKYDKTYLLIIFAASIIFSAGIHLSAQERSQEQPASDPKAVEKADKEKNKDQYFGPLAALLSSEEPSSLFGGKDIKFSGFGGPYVAMSKMGNRTAVFAGGKGALIVDDSLLLGGGGAGLAYPTLRSQVTGKSYTGKNKYVGFGYGGGLIGLNLFQKRMINFTFFTIIGAGGLTTYGTSNYSDSGQSNNDGQGTGKHCSRADTFFAMEPTAQVNINVTRWWRLGAGVSYRYIYGINTPGFKDSRFRGMSFILSAEFGWF